MTGNRQETGSRGFFARRPHFVPAIIATAVLLGALGEWPYGYYQFLRWIVCAAAVFTAYCGWQWKRTWAAWIFGFVAVLFNPLVPIHLNREIWRVIDFLSACLFIIGSFVIHGPIPSTRNEGH